MRTQPSSGSFPVQALILATSQPQDHRDLLLSYVQPDQGLRYWTAAANVLVQEKDREVMERLVGRLQLKLDITIHNGNRGFGGGGWGGKYGRRGSRFSYLRPEFPHVAYYTLTETPNRGAVALGPGPVVVYYERTLRRVRLSSLSSQARASGSSSSLDELINKRRFEILTSLAYANRLENCPLQLHRTETVHLRDGLDRDPTVASIVAETEGHISELLRKLDADLPESIRPSLEVNVDDQRSPPIRLGFPLPDKQADR